MTVGRKLGPRSGRTSILQLILAVLVVLACASSAQAQTVAGYSEYYLPGDELNMSYILNNLDTLNPGPNMHSVISLVAWAPATTVYYDHWENGYGFNPANPAATADEVFTVTNAGGTLVFESANIAPGGAPPAIRTAQPCTGQLNPLGVANGNRCYDGGDRIYVAGGAATLTRAVWLENRGADVQADSWEIYPVKPQLTSYVVPFGEDLFAQSATVYYGFQRVYTLIQATDDNTTVTVDLNNDGVPDILNLNRDATWNNAGDGTTVTLQRGQTFLLDRVSACPNQANCTTTPGALVTGTVITGNKTLQLKYVTGRVNVTYAARGLSSFPRGLWTNEYYAPLPQPNTATQTDYFLFNPHPTTLTVNWEGGTTSGSLTIPPNSTRSVRQAIGGPLPTGSAIFFRAEQDFWGVGYGDSQGAAFEFGYTLLPTSFLFEEHYMGWSPGALPRNSTPYNGNGVFVTVAQDNTRLFVDYDNDGTADQTYTLNRLQSQFVPPSQTLGAYPGDLAGARFWASGKFSMLYGENPETANASANSLDLGYVALPNSDFVSLVLTTEKTASPELIGTASGSTTQFTIKTNSWKYTIDGVAIVDKLPGNWEFVPDSATITRPNLTQLTGAAANPTITGAGTPLNPYVLTWSAAQTGGAMNLNQEILITFTGRTTTATTAGALHENNVSATGSRTVGTSPSTTQTFVAKDFAFVMTGAAQLTKTSNAANPAYPGDRFTYTVTATNPAAAGTNPLTRVSLYDQLPNGLTGVAGTTTLSRSTVADSFGSAAFNLNAGTKNWSGNWIENDPQPGGAGAAAGSVQVTGGALRLQASVATVSDTFSATSWANNNGNTNWATNWVETSTPNQLAADQGDQRDIYIVGGRLRLDRSNGATFAATRTATVTNGSTVVVAFTPYDSGIDGGDVVVVEYNVNGGTWAELGGAGASTFDGGTAGWTGVAQTRTIAAFPGTTIGLRFRATGTWGFDDFFEVDNVSITWNRTLGATAARTANLSGATQALLNLTAGGANLEADDVAVLEVSNAAAGPFTIIANSTTGPTPPYDISAYISANTTVRLRVQSGFDVADEWFSVDDLSITYNVSATGSDSPSLLSSDKLYTLMGGQSLVATFQVDVKDPLPTGLTSVTNTASLTSTELPFQLNATVTNALANTSASSATVSGRIWLDSDADGALDVGEPGIANVEVTLHDQYGTVIATQISNSTGGYLFSGVAPGTGYYVQATAPPNPGGYPTGLVQSSPIGATNDRTTSFSLAAGQTYDQANLGYASSASAVLFGDLAWVDGDADGIRDPGEVGLAGVKIKLYRDANANNTYDPGVDILVNTLVAGAGSAAVTNGSATVTGTGTSFTKLAAGDTIELNGVVYTIASVASDTQLTLTTNYAAASASGVVYLIPTFTSADGSYVFSGITPASGTYFVVASAAPAGYSLNGTGVFTFPNVIGGTSYSTADFPFVAAPGVTVTIQDRVWRDLDGNGVFDVGENGIGGVTVALLDATSTVIGSTTTAADGTFTFSGVAAGGNYRTKLTDVGGVLTSFIGTTSYAIAKERSELNVTASIDRSAAPSYGFNATRSIGDTIFNDANGNATQDVGELGMSGLTVRLHRDLNGNGLIDLAAGVGTVTVTNGSTTVTGTGTRFNDYRAGEPIRIGTNSYIIASIASSTSLTLATPAVAGATGSAFTANPLGTGTVATTAGSNLVTGTGTTFTNYRAGDPITINGTVYTILSIGSNTSLTLSSNAAATASGQAISGPRVFIASQATDAYGKYLFSGLADGSYVVSVQTPSGYTYIPGTRTDTDSFVAGIQLAATIAGTGNVLDRDFAFQVPVLQQRSVSGFVWTDSTPANGLVDATETALSGVTVNIFALQAGAGTVTATNGSSTVTGSGTSFTALGTGDIITIAGAPHVVASVTSATQLTLESPFAGTTGAGLAYLQGPTVTAATSTDATGRFVFSALSPGTYAIHVTDSNGLLTDYLVTWERTEGLWPATPNALEVVNLASSPGTVATTAGSATVTGSGTSFNSYRAGETIEIAGTSYKIASIASATSLTLTTSYPSTASGLAVSGPSIDYGYVTAAGPTFAEVRELAAVQDGRKVLITWHTSIETDNLGFNVYRDLNGTKQRINKKLIAGSSFITKNKKEQQPLAGYSYRITDKLSPGEMPVYWLEDVDLKGVKTLHGPARPVSGTLPGDGADSPALAGIGTGGSVFESPAGVGVIHPLTMSTPTNAEMKRQLELAAEPGLKILVYKPGLYRVTGAEMAAAGFAPDADAKRFALYGEGLEQPISVTTKKAFGPDDTIEFFGYGLDTRSTGARTYWLTLANGSNARLDARKGDKAPVYTGSIPFVTEKRERAIYFGFIGTEGEDFYGPMITGEPATQSIAVGAVDRSSTAAAILSVELRGATEMPHRVRVELNATVLGTVELGPQEQKVFDFTFAHTALIEGSNVMRLVALNGDEDVSVLVSTRLAYQHRLVADEDLLEAEFPAGRQITVAGFKSDDVRVLDVTDPRRPEMLEVTVSKSGEATFVTPSAATPRKVLLVGASRHESAELAFSTPSSWATSARTAEADLLVITNRAFAAQAQALAEQRTREGTRAVVVDVDDIYDELNFGVRGPEPIRRFIAGTREWRRAPQYVVLVGSASYDPRNYLEVVAVDFIPNVQVSTAAMKAPSDDWFTDFDDDGVADLPIGRLPVRTVEHASRIVSRLTSRGTPSGEWARRVLFVADASNTYNFPGAATSLARLVPPGLERNSVFLSISGRSTLVAALNQGALVVDYLGHGSVEIWKSYSTFSSTIATGLKNGDRLPLVLAMTCLNGMYDDLFAEPLAVALLTAPEGGAIGVWASSTLTEPAEQITLNRELMRHLFVPGTTVGDAMRKAKLAIQDPDIRRSWNFLGDPSMKLMGQQ